MDIVDIICFSILGFLCLICQIVCWYEIISETNKYYKKPNKKVFPTIASGPNKGTPIV